MDGELGICEKYHLSPNELYTVRAILTAQDEESTDYLTRFVELVEAIGGKFRDILISLQDKEIILKSVKIPEKGDIDIFDIKFNKAFVKYVYRASFEMGKELFEHYPQFAKINGMMVPIRGVSKKFNSLEDAYSAYGKAIKWKPEVHSEIIELLDWARENNIINCSLASFIVDRKWYDLKALKEGEAGNINFDTFKML